MKKSRHEILIYQDEDGRYIAECIDLPGCVSDGKTKGEAIENVREAIIAYLESAKKHRESIPLIKAPALVKVVV